MIKTQNPPRAGVIGTGIMGAPMARNILEQLGAVTVWSRRPEATADLAAAGATVAASPRELAQASDVVISVLPDLEQLEALLDGPDGLIAGALQPLVLVISSTSSPLGVQRVAERLDGASGGRVRVVDAPVSGGEDGAIAGTLSVMVGGDEVDVARATPVLEAVGRPSHLGGLGAGEVAKSCNQLIVASTALALGEAAVIADRAGIDVAALFDLFAGGYAGSRILQTRGGRIAHRDYRPSGIARYMVKDLGFATDAARSGGVEAKLLARLRDSYTELVALGFGEDDIAVTRAYVERMSGVDHRR